VVKDEPDNRVLECALAGRAEAIVTGDHALLALREYKSVRLISLRGCRAAEDRRESLPRGPRRRSYRP
jgi:predicted nucleic acid-binding protein